MSDVEKYGLRPFIEELGISIPPRSGLDNPPVHRIIEVMRLQDRRHAVENVVVQQQCTQQRLLCFDVVRLKPNFGNLTAVCHLPLGFSDGRIRD